MRLAQPKASRQPQAGTRFWSGFAKTAQYFDPVVLLGRASQVSLPVAAFLHAERLAYWQFSAPPAPLMQNLPVPVTCAELLPIVLLLSMELAAPAMEIPAINAATAASVVNVFMMTSLRVSAAQAAPTSTTG